MIFFPITFIVHNQKSNGGHGVNGCMVRCLVLLNSVRFKPYLFRNYRYK